MQFIKKLFDKIDPHHQSFIYFKWDFWNILICVVAIIWLYTKAQHAIGTTNYGENVPFLLSNSFSYLPNYLIHEMLGHNMVGNIGWRICYTSCPAFGQWWAAAMGNGVETLVPLLALVGVWQLKGGRYLSPILMYWLSTTLFEAGIYAADARAMKLQLTSSDMMSNFKPGEVLGDWHYILEPLGLLKFDVIIGHVLLFASATLCVLAIYSIWYYWSHIEDYSVI